MSHLSLQNHEKRTSTVRRVLLAVLLLNLAVALAKFVYGTISYSTAMQADGIHSIFDSAGNVVGLIGISLATRPADKEHPYGHFKLETFASLMIGLMLIFAAYQVGSSAVTSLIEGSYHTEVTAISFVVMVGTLAVNLFVTTYERRMGNRLKSDILKADAAHTLSDCLVSIGVIVGLILVACGIEMADDIMALIVMVINAGMLPEVLRRIFAGAFDFKAIFGGAAGFGSSALMQGIKRGLYSNEAGVGSAPNAAAAADVSHPVKQGLVQMLSVFIDTILVCTATAMMCLCTGIEPSESLKGAPFVQASLEQTFGAAGPYFITIALLLFAFTTLLGNLFYCEGCLNYIAGRTISHRQLNVFHAFACVVVFIGAQMKFGLVWDIADVLMGIMALINLPVILRLGDARAVGLYEAAPRGPEPGIQGEKYRAEGKDGLLELTCNRPQTVIPFLQQKPYQRCTICRKTKALTGCTAVWWA